MFRKVDEKTGKLAHHRAQEHQNARHVGQNLQCVFELTTTGPYPGYHDILELRVLPVDVDFRPSKVFFPMCLKMLPRRTDNIITGNSKHHKGLTIPLLKEHLDIAHDPEIAADLFHAWYKSLKLEMFARIYPLAFNWVKTSAFLNDWLGFHDGVPILHDYIDPVKYRDIVSQVHFLQDVAWFNLTELGGVAYENTAVKSHLMNNFETGKTDRSNVYYDCIDTANLFRLMRALHIPTGMNFIVR
jgi:hypothetical protein